MMNKMDEVFRKVLNDREIFWHKIEIFNEKEWTELRQIFDDYIKNNTKDLKDLIKERIDKKIRFIQRRNMKHDDKNKILKLLAALKNSVDEKPNLLYELLNTLDSYALVKCNLPNMENYGKVIERYDFSIVEEYFVDKIKRASYPQKKALERILEYVKELYSAGFSSDEIGYFVRKVNSLTKYWEVIE